MTMDEFTVALTMENFTLYQSTLPPASTVFIL